MVQSHPKLRFRPQSSTGVRRPRVEHPDLGELEYINRDGGWWQGHVHIDGAPVRLDVQQPANISREALAAAADFVKSARAIEPTLRDHIANQAAEGKVGSNIDNYLWLQPEIDAASLESLRPNTIVVWDDHADFRYDCDALPDGNLFGGSIVEVRINADKSGGRVMLLDFGDDRRAETLFALPLPSDATDFEGSIGDQFIAQAATGQLRLDADLRRELAGAIADAERRIAVGSPACVHYMTSVKALLNTFAKRAESKMVRILAQIQIEQPTAKFDPLKKKLVRDETFRLERTGNEPRASIGLAFVIPRNLEGTTAEDAIRAQFLAAAAWLGRHPATVFTDAAQEGYSARVEVDVLAHIGLDPIVFEVPPAFLIECGRLGLRMSVAINQSVDE